MRMKELHLSLQSKKAIEEWRMHILRTNNQDLARSNIINNMKKNEVLIERDWAMKFIPMVYRYIKPLLKFENYYMYELTCRMGHVSYSHCFAAVIVFSVIVSNCKKSFSSQNYLTKIIKTLRE